MKGYLLLYNTTNRKDITRINHELFGRIITVPKKTKTFRYYYAGSFENVEHVKITNGCYFTTAKGSECEGLVKYMEADIAIPKEALITAKKKWAEYAERKKFSVKHLNK